MNYIIGHPQILSSVYVKAQLYADDVKIYGVCDDETREEAHSFLQYSVEGMNCWAPSSGVLINAGKCTDMHLGGEDAQAYKINSGPPTSCSSTKDLGVAFDTALKFSPRIDSIVRKAYAPLFPIL